MNELTTEAPEANLQSLLICCNEIITKLCFSEMNGSYFALAKCLENKTKFGLEQELLEWLMGSVS